MSMEEAICVQSRTPVREDDLRKVYPQLERDYGKVTFYCPNCMELGQRTDIIACNCREDNNMKIRKKEKRRAYFRTNKFQPHHKQCKYYTDNIVSENSVQSGNKEIKQRHTNTMLDFRFPKVVAAATPSATKTSSNNSAIKVSKSNNVNSSIKRTKKDTETTEMLSKLVATYHNNPDANIIFPGKGECPVKEVFKKVSADTVHLDENGNGIDEKNKFVYIATVRKTELYGNDKDKFKFFFKERIGNYHVTIYLTKKNLIGYDYDELNNIHKQSEDKSTNKNITMYLLNPKFAKGQNAYGQDKIEIELKSMDYLYYEVETHS